MHESEAGVTHRLGFTTMRSVVEECRSRLAEMECLAFRLLDNWLNLE